jgi:WD40 repeat protein
VFKGGKRALSWSSDGALRLWDLESRKQIGRPLAGHNGEIAGALLLPAGEQALSWCDDGTLRLWDLKTCKQIAGPLAGHNGEIAGALLLPAG